MEITNATGEWTYCKFSIDMLWGKCDSFFPPTTTNIQNKIVPYLGQILGF